RPAGVLPAHVRQPDRQPDAAGPAGRGTGRGARGRRGPDRGRHRPDARPGRPAAPRPRPPRPRPAPGAPRLADPRGRRLPASRRVAARVARGPAASRLRSLRAVAAFFVPQPMQEAATELLGSTAWTRHRGTLRRALLARRDALLAALAEHAPRLTPGPVPR